MDTKTLFSPVGAVPEHYGKACGESLGQSVKRGLAHKAEQGDWPFRAPLGYLHTVKGSRKVIVIDKVRAPLVRRAFAMAAHDNVPLPAIRQAVTEKGLATRSGQPLSLAALCRMLTNPFYAGLLRLGEKTFPGKHQPLVSRECFQKVQDKLRVRKEAVDEMR